MYSQENTRLPLDCWVSVRKKTSNLLTPIVVASPIPIPRTPFTQQKKRDRRATNGISLVFYSGLTSHNPLASSYVKSSDKESSSLSPTHPRPLWQVTHTHRETGGAKKWAVYIPYTHTRTHIGRLGTTVP